MFSRGGVIPPNNVTPLLSHIHYTARRYTNPTQMIITQISTQMIIIYNTVFNHVLKMYFKYQFAIQPHKNEIITLIWNTSNIGRKNYYLNLFNLDSLKKKIFFHKN